MERTLRPYFGSPVDVDGKTISCVDVRYDLPQDRGQVVSLHPHLADEHCDPFISFCQRNGFRWERGAKRFYVDKSHFAALSTLQPETGIEPAYAALVIPDMAK